MSSDAIVFDNYAGYWTIAGRSVKDDHLKSMSLDSLETISRYFKYGEDDEIECRGTILIPADIIRSGEPLTLYLTGRTGRDVAFDIR